MLMLFICIYLASYVGLGIVGKHIDCLLHYFCILRFLIVICKIVVH